MLDVHENTPVVLGGTSGKSGAISRVRITLDGVSPAGALLRWESLTGVGRYLARGDGR